MLLFLLRRGFLADALRDGPFGLDRLASEFLRQLPLVLHMQHEGLVAHLPFTILDPFNFGIQKMAGLAVEVKTDQPNREVATAVWRVIMLFFHLLKGLVGGFVHFQLEDMDADRRDGDDVRLPVCLTVLRRATDALRP